jgi:alpha-mannosidase
MGLKSFIHKESGTQIICGDRFAGFHYIEEDAGKGMTAWIIGRYMKEMALKDNVRIIETNLDKNSLSQWISYEQEFLSSRLKVKIILGKNSSEIKYIVECDWQERAVIGKSIPQMNFRLPLAFNAEQYKYDVPFGTIVRKPFNQDVPANSWMAASNKQGTSAMLVTKEKYGFRGYDSSLSVTLLRSPYDPDPYPDNGIHKFSFAVSAVFEKSEKQLITQAYIYNHPLSFISNNAHEGDFPLDKGFIEVISENAVVSAIKAAEDNETGIICRVYETEGKTGKVIIRFDKQPVKACFTDLIENAIKGNISVLKEIIEFDINPNSVETIMVEF